MIKTAKMSNPVNPVSLYISKCVRAAKYIDLNRFARLAEQLMQVSYPHSRNISCTRSRSNPSLEKLASSERDCSSSVKTGRQATKRILRDAADSSRRLNGMAKHTNRILQVSVSASRNSSLRECGFVFPALFI